MACFSLKKYLRDFSVLYGTFIFRDRNRDFSGKIFSGIFYGTGYRVFLPYRDFTGAGNQKSWSRSPLLKTQINEFAFHQ